jgi:hypothetical protein
VDPSQLRMICALRPQMCFFKKNLKKVGKKSRRRGHGGPGAAAVDSCVEASALHENWAHYVGFVLGVLFYGVFFFPCKIHGKNYAL